MIKICIKQGIKYVIQTWIILITYSVLWYACATPGSPSGGPRDTTPPVMDTLVSSKSMQTNFEKQTIEFAFDEWVKLNKPFQEIVVSPPLEFQPSVTIRKKTVVFEFDEEEVLRENATYTINFGEAVQDLTEGNSVPDLRYVFSTGDQIDSLELSGVVWDAITRAPMKDVYVMLYENTADTVVRTERPFYFAKSDDTGNYRIRNLRGGTFKIFALGNDSREKYIYDAETELIGFQDGLITISDSLMNQMDLSVFVPSIPTRLEKDELTAWGLATLSFNQAPDDVVVDFQDVGQNLIKEIDEKNIKLWFDNEQTFDIYLSNDTLWNDTIRIPGKPKADFLSTAELTIQNLDQLGKPKSMNPFVDIIMEANHPLIQMDTSLIRVWEDSIRTRIQPIISIDSSLARNLIFKYPWKEEMSYEIYLSPGAITDVYDIKNDTIQQKYYTLPRTQFGSIKLKMSNLDSLQHYILQLKSKNGNLVKDYYVKDKSHFEENIKALYPGEYEITIIVDNNKNEKWDSGDYDEQKQPEAIYTEGLEALRANWELDADLDFERMSNIKSVIINNLNEVQEVLDNERN